MESTPVTLLDQLRGPVRGDAWTRFVDLYTPLLARWSGRLGVAAADRSDLLQDTFLAVYRGLSGYSPRPGRQFRGWLYVLFVNKWRERLRRTATIPAAGLDADVPDPNDPIAAVDEAEYRAVLAARAMELLRAEFTPATWRAFWATAAEGRPAAAVGAELGMTANAVYLARSRVLARLRAELAGLLD